ncbi:helix-turn-helix domain-containing protein [Pseudomonas putida]|uniref:helix-turn-helix domain-containing protein n=1 Tax=Pseudomonas TaxID=286 RepID=UPI0035A4254E
MTHTQTTPTLAIGIDDAARAIGVSRSVIYEVVARGELPSFKLGRRRMILAKELETYINRVAVENAR